MAWTLNKTKIYEYCRHIRQRLSCCDLCYSNISVTYLFDKPISQAFVCQCCLDQLPLFHQQLISGNLLNWPAINQALPKITFDQLFSLAPYSYPFHQWLRQLKYSGRFELANVFALLLSKQWSRNYDTEQNTDVDLVISIPLHTNKWQLRGYNQAHLIAKEFAKQLQLPYKADLCKRVKHNESQMGKTGKERRKNLAKAFTLQDNVAEHIKHVIIVDDVVTTGSTANEVSKLLKRAGVEKITLVTVCISLPKNSG